MMTENNVINLQEVRDNKRWEEFRAYLNRVFPTLPVLKPQEYLCILKTKEGFIKHIVWVDPPCRLRIPKMNRAGKMEMTSLLPGDNDIMEFVLRKINEDFTAFYEEI